METTDSKKMDAPDWVRVLIKLNGKTDYGVVVDDPNDYGWEECGCAEQLRVPYSHENVDCVCNGSLSAIWLGDISAATEDRIAAWWPKLKAGGYLGGRRYNDLLLTANHSFLAQAEIGLGQEVNPDWSYRKFSEERVEETTEVIGLDYHDPVPSAAALAVEKKKAFELSNEAEKNAWKVHDRWREAVQREFRQLHPEVAAEVDAVNALREEWAKRKRALGDLDVEIPNGFLE